MTGPSEKPVLSVFVIGDSISMQYGPYLERSLGPRFAYGRKRGEEAAMKDLDQPAGGNGGDSARVRSYMSANDVHGEIPHVDFLLVNCGLHDIKMKPDTNERQVDIDSYCENLEAIARLGTGLSEVMCWVRTTPCEDGIHNKPGMAFHRRRADLLEYNRAADAIMQRAGVPAIDLFSFTESLGLEAEDLYCDHVHFHEHVREKQAAFIAGWLQGYAASAWGR